MLATAQTLPNRRVIEKTGFRSGTALSYCKSPRERPEGCAVCFLPCAETRSLADASPFNVRAP